MRTAFFAPKTLSHLPADNVEALAALCTEFERFDGHARQLPEHHNDYVEALGILKAFAAARAARLDSFPEVGPQSHQNIATIVAYFGQVRAKARNELSTRHARGYLESKTEEYLNLFSRAAVYEFSEADYKRLQDLINELRELIRDGALLSEDHRGRLLRRLEAMRAELHRRTGDIDRFWGFLGEAAIVTRKFGDDLAPVADRVLELAGIVIGVIFAREGITALPELSRLLHPQPRPSTPQA